MPTGAAIIASPDENGAGLIDGQLDALRYDGQSDHPDEVAGILHSMMPANARVLDVGCGTGSVTVIANRNRNNDVLALEPDTARAAVARSRGIAVQERLLDDGFIAEHGTFDVVMASDVMEHTPAPAEFLAAMVKATRPGGTILISVPNVAHWSVRLNLLAGRFNYESMGIMDATHLRWFTEETLTALFNQAGLEIIEFRHTAGVDLPVHHRGLVSRIPEWLRVPAIRMFTRAIPRVFAVQHVVKARVPSVS